MLNAEQQRFIDSISVATSATDLVWRIQSGQPAKHLNLSGMSRTDIEDLADEFVEKLATRIIEAARRDVKLRLSEIFELPPAQPMSRQAQEQMMLRLR